ncbi:hypothetical protein BGW37DRAFT_507320 [Umbelopsis sp. PMI_123]|nr:hypothetical protein BGW37DRAFT_507320 [Umbelopsis sp. PMI_123]
MAIASRGSFRGGQSRLGSTRANKSNSLPNQNVNNEPSNLDQRFEDVKIRDEIDARLGFERYQEGPEKLGWLINMHSTIVKDSDWPSGRAAVDYYFIAESGDTFKTTLLYDPYFYIGCKPGTETEVEEYLRRRFENVIEKINRVRKEDLKQPNHLLGRKRTYLQLIFRNVTDLLSVRKIILPTVKKNQKNLDAIDTYADIVNETNNIDYENTTSLAALSSRRNPHETLDNIIDIREYDIPYFLRVAIDMDIRVGLWYNVKAMQDNTIQITRRPDLVNRAEPVILAFDIETTKLPLKFPDSSIDSIMMISYMIDGQGYLITNREIVSQDIDDFEYTPKPEYEGPFIIFNEADELALLRRFFEHIQDAQPTVFVTYNGDFFDWPFIEARAKFHGINMYEEIGFYKDEEDEYKSKHASHMDAFRWVKRDSYLPQGSQGLKAVTTAKLGYNPLELDPEDMTRFASEQPQTLAQYSVSDAVATYYLYMKYVHPFIFSLCNIIPLTPDEVLRKGSGTLCEILLMVEAYNANVIMPNKHVDETGKMFEGHLLESETYVGGHVEALEAGVFRSDLPTHFKIDPAAAQELIDQIDDALKFTIQVEEKLKLEDVENYDEVRDNIVALLEDMRDNPMRHEEPLIYHLDVAAMYPNIILTNRLQPDAMIEESMCASCDFNRPGKTCDRRMTWSWRGEYFPAKRNEYNMIKNQLSIETFPAKRPGDPARPWHQLSETEQSSLLQKRLTEYCRKVYRKIKETRTVQRESIICQRENPFYIETVKAFRDRRYEYKGLHKTWKKNLDGAASEGSLNKVVEAKKMIVLYDSLQLAHKCILNSFYGYVMRKGARWHSLEMAGIVCLTGAKIIQMARQLVERIGRPLELDTDGIWCILPKSFPEKFTFKTKNGKKIGINYPCTMLNHLVHAQFTNHQYQTLTDKEKFEYSVHSENSIFFEVDGPYRAMILPSSKEEDKLLKKRYAVFDHDGSLAELKGFEVKRRGELKLIKIFQSQLFKVFLEGSSLDECYSAVAHVANQWLDVLYSKAVNLQDEELFELISENRSMSKTLEDYGAQKSTSISTARRLAEFLGDQMVKDKGLACKFIISARPFGIPVSERAVPVAIFSAEPSIKKHFLRKWLKDDSLTSFDIRDILDWPYYLERFGSVIQKLITIPAAMQKVSNPVPRVRHPDWLFKRVAQKDDKFKQNRITDMFGPATGNSVIEEAIARDIEDLGVQQKQNGKMVPKIIKQRKRKSKSTMDGRRDLESDDDLPENMPDMHENYSDWLQFQKRKWKKQRVARIKRRETGEDDATQMGADVSASGYFRRHAGSLVSSPWHILQIVESDTLGEYRMWVVIQRSLYCINLSVPRIFYVNSHDSQPTESLMSNSVFSIEPRVKTLPRSHQCLNLFEMTMPESVFQAEQKKFASFFNHPSTEGVYETQIPLLTRAILNLGCVSKVDRKGSGGLRKMEDRFSLLDFVQDDTLSKDYLSQPKTFNYLYLYHAHADSRHMFALVGTALTQSRCFIVGTNREHAQMPNLNQLYKHRFAEHQRGQETQTNETIDYKEDMDFETTYHSSEKDALKAIQKELVKYQTLKRGPTIIAISSPRSTTQLVQQVRIMSEFPYVSMQSYIEDKRLPSIDWLRPTAARMINQYLNLGSWLTEKLLQSRYASIPFCNIENDPYLYLADIAFARRLMKNDMVLWWSPSFKPDLGGREEDENLYAVDELINPEINHPGSYSNVCFELDILRLCLNTLMEAPIINELEGSNGGIGFDNVAHTLDEYNSGKVNNTVSFGDGTLSAKTFSMLRGMVQTWFHEALEHNNRFAEMMIDTLHRWLTSPSSNMYDPCLYGLVHGMMKKVFMQLVAEFRRVGSQIVFANFNKIIVVTPKESMESGLPYCDYLLKAVQGKQVFEVLDIVLSNYWDQLLWMDEMNYGGILREKDNASEPSENNAVVTMQWNIQDYLPLGTQDIFQRIIASFVYTTYNNRVKRIKENRDDPYAHFAQDQQDGDTAMNEINSVELELTRKYVRQDLTRRLLKQLGEIIKDQVNMSVDQDIQTRLSFPQFAGSHLQLDNAALELVKSVCAVLALDKGIESEVRVMKRNALNLIGSVPEFSDKALFQNPCEYFKLAQVICSYCNYTTDLDFCRDRDLLPENGQVKPWRCKGCGTEYDKSFIEETLIGEVQRRLMAFQLQDLQCSKCHRVKQENLLKNCGSCGGNFVQTQRKSDLISKLTVFRNIAREQKLRLLVEIVDWTLANC